MSKKILAMMLSLMVLVVFTPCIAFADDEEIDVNSIFIAKDGGQKCTYVDQYGDTISTIKADANATFQLYVYDSEGKELAGDFSWESWGGDYSGCPEITEKGEVSTNDSEGYMNVQMEGTLQSGDEIYGNAKIYIAGYTEKSLKDSKGVYYCYDIELTSKKTGTYDVVNLPDFTAEKGDYYCTIYNTDVIGAEYKNGKLTIEAKKTGHSDVDMGKEEGNCDFWFSFIVNGTTKFTNSYSAIVYSNKMAEITYMEAKKTVTVPSKIKYIKSDGKKKYVGTYTVKKIYNGALQSPKTKVVKIPKTVTSIGKNAFGYYWNDDDEFVKVKELTIYAKKGSAGYKYAKNNKFTWKKWNK